MTSSIDIGLVAGLLLWGLVGLAFLAIFLVGPAIASFPDVFPETLRNCKKIQAGSLFSHDTPMLWVFRYPFLVSAALLSIFVLFRRWSQIPDFDRCDTVALIAAMVMGIISGLAWPWFAYSAEPLWFLPSIVGSVFIGAGLLLGRRQQGATWAACYGAVLLTFGAVFWWLVPVVEGLGYLLVIPFVIAAAVITPGTMKIGAKLTPRIDEMTDVKLP
jgi:hypothetical protein